MPRNPVKALCEVHGCRSWAKRGYARCRAHLDAELGPRAVGAPSRNLNALQHGGFLSSHSTDELISLAERILQQPDELPQQIALLLGSVHARTGDPFLTLAALSQLLPGLVARIAASLFATELAAYLDPLPPPVRPRAEAIIDHYLGHCGPEQQLLVLRKIKRSRNNYLYRDPS